MTNPDNDTHLPLDSEGRWAGHARMPGACCKVFLRDGESFICLRDTRHEGMCGEAKEHDHDRADNDTPLRTTAEERAAWIDQEPWSQEDVAWRRRVKLLVADVAHLLARAEAAEAEVARLREELEAERVTHHSLYRSNRAAQVHECPAAEQERQHAYDARQALGREG